MVTLQVFHEGQEPGAGRALATIPLTVKDGAVSARWSWKSDAREMPPEADPRFIFTAHCAWCNFEKSSNSLEVKLKRPEITKVEWQDKDGNTTSKGLVGETLKLHAETKNMEGGVTFFIYDSSTGKQAASIGANVEGDKAEAEWTYHWDGIPLKEKPKFKFEVRGNRCKKVESSEVEIGMKYEIPAFDENGEPLKNTKFTVYFSTDKSVSANSDDEGNIIIENEIPSKIISIETSKITGSLGEL